MAWKAVAAGAATAAGILLVSGCGSDAPAKSADAPKVLKSCAVDGLMPYSSSKDSRPGLEIEMARELAKRMGMTNQTVWVGSWDGLIPSLTTKQCDAIIDGLFITDERKKQVDFTNPTWGSGEAVLSRKDSNNPPVTSLDALKGKCVGALQGSVTVQHLKDAGIKDVKIYPSQNEVILDLANKSCDYAYLESPSAGWALNQAPGINVKVEDSYKPDEVFYEGIAIRKGDTELKGKLDSAIAEIQKDGTLAKILESYGVPVYLPGAGS